MFKIKKQVTNDIVGNLFFYFELGLCIETFAGGDYL